MSVAVSAVIPVKDEAGNVENLKKMMVVVQ